jgi:Repeat of unknown function (DUF346)
MGSLLGAAGGAALGYPLSPALLRANKNLTQTDDDGTLYQIASDPVVADSARDVFARNANGELIHYYRSDEARWRAENLTQPPSIGAVYRIASDPVVFNLDVFARNASGELVHYYWSNEAGWRAENLTQRPSIGTAYRITSDPVVNLLEVYDPVTGAHVPTEHVFARNTRGEMIHYYWSPQTSWRAESMTRYQNNGPAYPIEGSPSALAIQYYHVEV